MHEQLTFDHQQAQQAKREGMTLAADHRKDLLQRVRARLMDVASQRESKTATADDAQEILIGWGYQPFDLGNAAGSLFRGWHFTGKWLPSRRVSNHGHQNRVWRLK